MPGPPQTASLFLIQTTHERSFLWGTAVTEPSAGTARVINTQTPSGENGAADEAKRLAPGLALVLQLELMSGSENHRVTENKKQPRTVASP